MLLIIFKAVLSEYLIWFLHAMDRCSKHLLGNNMPVLKDFQLVGKTERLKSNWNIVWWMLVTLRTSEATYKWLTQLGVGKTLDSLKGLYLDWNLK